MDTSFPLGRRSVGLTRGTAMTFVILLGLVSLFADMTYEGARSITGPYLAVLSSGLFSLRTPHGRYGRSRQYSPLPNLTTSIRGKLVWLSRHPSCWESGHAGPDTACRPSGLPTAPC